MPQLLYIQGKSPWYPLDRRLDGPQDWSGHSGKEKKSIPYPYQESNYSHPAHSLSTTLTKLLELPEGKK
jgi:hypothetical protein